MELLLCPDPLIVSAVAINSTAIGITWEVPMAVHNQGFDSVGVDVQSRCFTDRLPMSVQTFTVNNNRTTGVVAGSLGKFSLIKKSPLQCSAQIGYTVKPA